MSKADGDGPQPELVRGLSEELMALCRPDGIPWARLPQDVLGREFFPDATNEEVGNILWNHTGYPHFWHTTLEYPTVESVARKQLGELKKYRDEHGEYPDPLAGHRPDPRPDVVAEGGKW